LDAYLYISAKKDDEALIYENYKELHKTNSRKSKNKYGKLLEILIRLT
jgi:hypothetical protein